MEVSSVVSPNRMMIFDVPENSSRSWFKRWTSKLVHSCDDHRRHTVVYLIVNRECGDRNPVRNTLGTITKCRMNFNRVVAISERLTNGWPNTTVVYHPRGSATFP